MLNLTHAKSGMTLEIPKSVLVPYEYNLENGNDLSHLIMFVSGYVMHISDELGLSGTMELKLNGSVICFSCTTGDVMSITEDQMTE